MNTHTNKNAYEIRLEILKMAHDDATGKYYQKLDFYRRDADRFDKELDTAIIESLFPTSAEILVQAEELYKFVQDGR
jgi:hypothetical protein